MCIKWSSLVSDNTQSNKFICWKRTFPLPSLLTWQFIWVWKVSLFTWYLNFESRTKDKINYWYHGLCRFHGANNWDQLLCFENSLLCHYCEEIEADRLHSAVVFAASWFQLNSYAGRQPHIFQERTQVWHDFSSSLTFTHLDQLPPPTSMPLPRALYVIFLPFCSVAVRRPHFTVICNVFIQASFKFFVPLNYSLCLSASPNNTIIKSSYIKDMSESRLPFLPKSFWAKPTRLKYTQG